MNKKLILSGSFNRIKYNILAEELLGSDLDNLDLYITSDGGIEHYGRAAAGLIQQARKKRQINTYGFGDIHSTAVLVFAAGEKRFLSKFAVVMVHESECVVDGNSTEMKKQAKQMEKDEKFWCDALAGLTGTDSKTWLNLHEKETYLQPQEALELNLATELI